MSRARARTEGLLIMTPNTDALPGEPSRKMHPASRCCDNTHHFAPETHARSEKQRTFGVESFLRCLLLSRCAPMTPTTITRTVRATKTTMVASDDKDDPTVTANKTTNEGKFGGKSPRHLARENIAGYPSWTLIKRGLRGVCARRYSLSRWVTQGSTAPGGVL